MSTVLVTGGAGFFGDVLKRRLLADGFDCVSIDLQPDPMVHPRLQSIQADIQDAGLLDEALGLSGSTCYHVGSDHVKPLRQVYEHVIAEAGTDARVASLPQARRSPPCGSPARSSCPRWARTTGA